MSGKIEWTNPNNTNNVNQDVKGLPENTNMLFKAKLFSFVVYFTFLVFYLLKFNSVKTQLLYY